MQERQDLLLAEVTEQTVCDYETPITNPGTVACVDSGDSAGFHRQP